MQVANLNTGNRQVNVELVEKAQEALELARQFCQAGHPEEATDLYDDAFVIFSRELGETHPLSLETQREYSILLTAQHMLASTLRRRMN
jgi:hypothetical protein